jgi:predicted phosphodiesterase
VDFALIVPDTHIPFEDKRAFELMLQVCRSLNIRIVVLLGDFLDMYGVSAYDKHPGLGDMGELFEREFAIGKQRIEQLESLDAGMYAYLCGNHEYRLEKALTQYSGGALRNSISVPVKLGLGDHWRWISYTDDQKFQIPGTKIYTRHEPPAGGGIDNIAKQAGASIIFGHDHSVRECEFVSKVSHESCVAAGSGWLGDQSQLVFKYVKRKPNWALAFRLVDEHQNVHLVRINKKGDRYLAVFGDKEYWG